MLTNGLEEKIQFHDHRGQQTYTCRLSSLEHIKSLVYDEKIETREELINKIINKGTSMRANRDTFETATSSGS